MPGNGGEEVGVLGKMDGEWGGDCCGESLLDLSALISFSESVHFDSLGKVRSTIAGNVVEVV